MFSIPAVLLYAPVLNNASYILGAGADTRVQLGAFLEVLTAIANIATAVVLFPILKRQSEGIALGYVAVLFGAYEQHSAVNFLFTLPEIVWEAALGIWLTVKGFRPSPILTGQVLTSS